MAGTNNQCNHVIAVMYKIDYAYQKGYLDKVCTDIPCNLNQDTKKIYNQKW